MIWPFKPKPQVARPHDVWSVSHFDTPVAFYGAGERGVRSVTFAYQCDGRVTISTHDHGRHTSVTITPAQFDHLCAFSFSGADA